MKDIKVGDKVKLNENYFALRKVELDDVVVEDEYGHLRTTEFYVIAIGENSYRIGNIVICDKPGDGSDNLPKGFGFASRVFGNEISPLAPPARL